MTIRDRLLELVGLAAPQIDSDYHSLVVTDSDRDRPYYNILRQRLQAFQAATKGINRIYTLRQQPNGSIVYAMDYAPPPNPIATVGETLNQLTPLLSKGLIAIQQPVDDITLVVFKQNPKCNL